MMKKGGEANAYRIYYFHLLWDTVWHWASLLILHYICKITGSISFCMKMKSIPKYFMIEIVIHDGEDSHKGVSVRW